MGVACALVFALDQVTKQMVVANVERGEQINFFIGLDLTYVRNEGIAFGIGSGGTTVVVVTLLALALLLGWFAAHATMPRLWLPVGALVGGAVGNLADRAREGYVIDFIDPVAWPAFNAADTAIVLGLLGLLYVAEADAARRRETATVP
jgi:signal peptidase II